MPRVGIESDIVVPMAAFVISYMILMAGNLKNYMVLVIEHKKQTSVSSESR